MAAPERPPFTLRLLLLAALIAFAGLDHNPLVRLEAWLGLSPSPLERFAGVRGPFSGMTEATYQLTHLNFGESLRANVLTLPLLLFATACLLLWRTPRLSTRRREYAFFAMAVGAGVINNLAPIWLSVT
jgi:hypothetical protein